MDVVIQERRFSWFFEYDITVPGAMYYARKPFFSIFDDVKLKTQDGQILGQMKGMFSLFRNRYDLMMNEGRVYRFECQKIIKGVYTCVRADDVYTLYRHKGFRFSIFKNNEQVASIEKNQIVIGRGHRYSIRMNSDGDIPLTICMTLALNSGDVENDDDSAVKINFGSFGPEERPFDSRWQPR